MWGIFEGDDIHVVPCDDEGHVYGGHELSRDCKCHPKAVIEAGKDARGLYIHNPLH